MIKFIYIPLLVFTSLAHSAPLSWPLDAVAQIQRAKTVKDITCASHQSVASQELCELFTKDHSLKKKFNIETINDSTLVFKSGSLNVKLERTNEPMKFMINDRLIDLKRYPNQERLSFALDAALRPREARTFQLMNEAFAAEIDPSIKPAVQGMLVLTQQDGNCDAYKKFTETCMADTEPILDYFKSNDAAYRAANQAKIKKAIDEKMKAVSLGLEKIQGAVMARYGYALNCDCKDNAAQTSCADDVKQKIQSLKIGGDGGRMRDIENMTAPRQKGFDRCERFLNQVDMATAAKDLSTATAAENNLKKIDEILTGIKAEAPAAPGSDTGSNK
jgi:hypothetical protein